MAFYCQKRKGKCKLTEHFMDRLLKIDPPIRGFLQSLILKNYILQYMEFVLRYKEGQVLPRCMDSIKLHCNYIDGDFILWEGNNRINYKKVSDKSFCFEVKFRSVQWLINPFVKC